MYGWRLRIGLIIPSSNTTMESEFSEFTPNGVSLHTTRLPLENVTEQELTQMAENVEESANLVSHVQPDIIIFGCTTGSLIKGKGYDQELERRIENSTGITAVSTAEAVLRVLRKDKIQKMVIVTPYTETINEKEKRFFEENGFDVEKMTALGLEKNKEIGQQTPQKAYLESKKALSSVSEYDGLFISCTNFRTFGVLDSLSDDIGKPVISSNLASLEIALEECGLSNLFESLQI